MDKALTKRHITGFPVSTGIRGRSVYRFDIRVLLWRDFRYGATTKRFFGAIPINPPNGVVIVERGLL
jgi:hypothetical protein